MNIFKKYQNSPYSIFMFFFVYYMGNAIFYTYIQLYYRQCGLTQTQIGVLSALGPFITTVAQFFWGAAADKAKYKNNVVSLAIALSAVTVYAYTISANYKYFIFITIVFNLAYCSILQLIETIALEYCSKTGSQFSTARMGGTIGYAFMATTAGIIIGGHTERVFLLSSLTFLLLLLQSFLSPRIKGGSNKKKLDFKKLFLDKRLNILMILNTLIYITFGVYMTFYSILLSEKLHATSFQIGFNYTLGALCEIPFLCFAPFIIKKLGIKKAIFIAYLIAGLRWFLYGTVTSIGIMLLASCLHGGFHIVVSYCTSMYISKNVDDSLKASAQGLWGIASCGISRIIGSFIGGIISDAIGLSQTFIICSVISVICAFVFILIYPKENCYE